MKINLQKSFFTETKKEFLSYGNFMINAFKYQSGVQALEIKNERCSFIFTPFKGQQIWHFVVDGREISMQTTIKEPQNTMTYLQNYGGFLYHCGIISFGAADLIHSQHGEIPNAEYDSAYIICDEDEKGKYICLGGELNHDTAFIRKYRFSPELKIYENGTVFRVNVQIDNLRAEPLEYMYLCHINFRPFDGSKIICSAQKDLEHVKIYKAEGSKELMEYYDRLEKDITLMDQIGIEGQCYNPEICFGIKYESDESGRAYTLQYENDGACYVSHPVNILSNGIRWISRTATEDALGMVLPATAEHIGYENAKNTGQFKLVPPNESIEFYMEAGYLDKEDADNIKGKIEKIMS